MGFDCCLRVFSSGTREFSLEILKNADGGIMKGGLALQVTVKIA